MNQDTEKNNKIELFPGMLKQRVLGIDNIPEGLKIDEPYKCSINIKVARDGRIWMCINGIAFIRFKPLAPEQMAAYQSG